MLRSKSSIGVLLCWGFVALSIGVVPSRGEDVPELDVPSEVVNVTGTIPVYNNRSAGIDPVVEDVDKKDATFTVAIDFDAKLIPGRELIWDRDAKTALGGPRQCLCAGAGTHHLDGRSPDGPQWRI